MRLGSFRKMIVAACLPGGMACTPLGLWMYEDPGITVSRVRVGVNSLSPAPVLIALDLENRNDFPVSAVHVQLSLALDDQPIGELNRDSTVIVPKDTISTVALPLATARVGRLTRFRSGTHRFTVMGRAEFTTPIGTRKVTFAQEGDLKFGPASTPTADRDTPDG